ncbi:hypothetical protein J4444_01300 [Candidatus Woesearchaeota archaeon]|nr:hypothetical protein [Candidatus Woesearchaeota archaeon]
MPRPNFRDPNFWKELRTQTSLDGRVGVEECYVWCKETFSLLSGYPNHGFRMQEGAVSTDMKAKWKLYVDAHWFLYREYKLGIFIADGTAGQIRNRYPVGYYGYFANAPKPLSLFYKRGLEWAGFNLRPPPSKTI